MKTTKLIATGLMVAFAGLFVSCNDDDSDSCAVDYTGELSQPEMQFVGTWSLTAIQSSEPVDLTDDDTENPSTDIFAQNTPCRNDVVYEFNEDRTFTYMEGLNEEDCNEENINGTWMLGGNTLGLVTGCFEVIEELAFNASRTSYSVSSEVNIVDVNGQSQAVELTFTYTQGPNMEDPEPAFE
ncbi:DUF5004 domain-containing protein [Galbibacter mesophilus]|uniref:DUF5004 domain-containing protein n=1 Tax=Galbibacter mesophilus TaxID=379069 RepID=UPI00191FE55E|nr:DUF5004 domain-containing protein [Galbibacter mesophilus]MCM5662466.1 DUF5004 domain-containing protein [Galbibacter mesophilus]